MSQRSSPTTSFSSATANWTGVSMPALRNATSLPARSVTWSQSEKALTQPRSSTPAMAFMTCRPVELTFWSAPSQCATPFANHARSVTTEMESWPSQPSSSCSACPSRSL